MGAYEYGLGPATGRSQHVANQSEFTVRRWCVVDSYPLAKHAAYMVLSHAVVAEKTFSSIQKLAIMFISCENAARSCVTHLNYKIMPSVFCASPFGLTKEYLSRAGGSEFLLYNQVVSPRPIT